VNVLLDILTKKDKINVLVLLDKYLILPKTLVFLLLALHLTLPDKMHLVIAPMDLLMLPEKINVNVLLEDMY
jgi:hypothetical protein